VHAESNLAVKQEGKQGSLFILALLAPLVGAASGLLGAFFRLALDQADLFRDMLIARAHEVRLVGFLFVVAASAGAVAIAAWLVRRFSPPASGSGIPHVEAVLTGELPPAPAQLIPVKFFGGLLAIGAGLALGREGPSVQMGAAIADLIGRICRLSWSDRQVLLAAGAGAGLATAFNAPIAGAVFVLEELVRRFDARIAIVALGASAGAIAVARMLLGSAPDLDVEPLAYAGIQAWPFFVVLGASPDWWRPFTTAHFSERFARRSGSAAGPWNSNRVSSAPRSEYSRGSRPDWRAAGTRSPSMCWRAKRPSRRSPWLFCCASVSERSRTRCPFRAGFSLQCWCWGRSSACFLAQAAGSLSPSSASNRNSSPSSGWRPFSPASYRPRLPVSC